MGVAICFPPVSRQTEVTSALGWWVSGAVASPLSTSPVVSRDGLVYLSEVSRPLRPIVILSVPFTNCRFFHSFCVYLVCLFGSTAAGSNLNCRSSVGPDGNMFLNVCHMRPRPGRPDPPGWCALPTMSWVAWATPGKPRSPGVACLNPTAQYRRDYAVRAHIRSETLQPPSSRRCQSRCGDPP